MTRLWVATTNRDKVREIREILGDLPVELRTLEDRPHVPAPEETGHTFEENARLKATGYAAVTGELTVAEDSGLEVDALGGAPGVESARYGGAATSYPEKFARLYESLERTGSRDRTARFVCALCLADPQRVIFETRGTIEGEMAPAPRGSGGFGYDPVFFYPPFGCTLAEAADRKSLVSHRGRAFRALRDFLRGGR